MARYFFWATRQVIPRVREKVSGLYSLVKTQKQKVNWIDIGSRQPSRNGNDALTRPNRRSAHKAVKSLSLSSSCFCATDHRSANIFATSIESISMIRMANSLLAKKKSSFLNDQQESRFWDKKNTQNSLVLKLIKKNIFRVWTSFKIWLRFFGYLAIEHIARNQYAMYGLGVMGDWHFYSKGMYIVMYRDWHFFCRRWKGRWLLYW